MKAKSCVRRPIYCEPQKFGSTRLTNYTRENQCHRRGHRSMGNRVFTGRLYSEAHHPRRLVNAYGEIGIPTYLLCWWHRRPKRQGLKLRTYLIHREYLWRYLIHYLLLVFDKYIWCPMSFLMNSDLLFPFL